MAGSIFPTGRFKAVEFTSAAPQWRRPPEWSFRRAPAFREGEAALHKKGVWNPTAGGRSLTRPQSQGSRHLFCAKPGGRQSPPHPLSQEDHLFHGITISTHLFLSAVPLFIVRRHLFCFILSPACALGRGSNARGVDFSNSTVYSDCADVALESLESLYLGAINGRLTRVNNRGGKLKRCQGKRRLKPEESSG